MARFIVYCWGDNPNEPGHYNIRTIAASKERAWARRADEGHTVLSVEEDPTADSCPRCHEKLVPRTNGITGVRFRGCSQYPRCGYTEPIEEIADDH